MVSRERLELSTPGLKGPCSNQLSYQPNYFYYSTEGQKRKGRFL